MDFWKTENGDRSLMFDIFFLCFLMIVGLTMTSLIMNGLAPHFGIGDLNEALDKLNPDSDPGLIKSVRFLHIFPPLFMFAVPAIFFAQILYKGKGWNYLLLKKWPANRLLIPGAFLCVIALPFMQFTYWLNQKIPLPGYFRDMEDQAAGMTEALLTMPDLSALLMNIFVVAAIPAIGEELLFRGVLQRIFIRLSKRPQWGIWAAAFAFSAIHMQFEGFIPRLLLGALLGYLVYWSGSLWLAILAHFANNAIQMIVQYYYDLGKIPLDLENIDRFPIWLSMISLIFTAGLVYYLYKNSLKEQEAYASQIENNFKEPNQT